MKLEQLTIQILPGIEPGFVLKDITPKVNFVTGPNGVGKSSLIRSLRYLIGGVDNDDPMALSLSADFSNGGHWRVERTGSLIIWQFEGKDTDPPVLPGRDQLHCYWLSMEELLQADQRDEHLVAELRRVMAGGYDIKALRDVPVFSVGTRIGKSEERRLQDAQKQLHHVENEYEALYREEEQLPGLEARIEDARLAVTRTERLNQAIELLEIRQQCREAEAVLATFPDNMNRLHGDELARLNRLEERRVELQAERETISRQKVDAETDLSKAGLEKDRPTSEALEAEKSRLETVRSNCGVLAERQGRLERAQAEVAQTQSKLGGQDEQPDLTPMNISEAETMAHQLNAKQTEIDELTARMNVAPALPAEQDISSYSHAAEALRSWIAFEDARTGNTMAGLVAAAVGAIVTIGAAAYATAWIAVISATVTLACVILVAWLSRDYRTTDAQQRYEETGLESPAEWRHNSVSEHLVVIEAHYAELLRARLLAQEVEGQMRRLEHARKELERLERERAEMAVRLGFDPMLTALGLDHFVRHVDKYQQAEVERAAQQSAVDRLRREKDELLRQVGEFLSCWHIEIDHSLYGLTAALAELEERCRDAEKAERQSATAARDLERLEKDLAILDDDRAVLYRDAGLEDGERVELDRCCECLEAWRNQRNAVRDAERREVEKCKALEGEPELLTEVERDSRELLERERDQSKKKAEALEVLQDRRTGIRTRLELAGRDQKLEKALADLDTSRDALRECRDRAIFADAGRFLLDEVEQEHRSEHEPEVLHDARERFHRFTHFEWDLILDDEHGFTARDRQRGRQHKLSELSSGTRMQLLLAVRLAWTRRIEQGRESLPLFLDEALTTADEPRFKSIAESLEQLAEEEDRQVFYLSARRQEVAMWEHLTGQHPHHIDLAVVRFGGHSAVAEQLVLPERHTLPKPDGKAPELYAVELGVPPVDPSMPAGDLHLFHLLRDDLLLLHYLMEDWLINSLGQMEFLLDSTAGQTTIPNDDTRERLVGRCAAARAWFAAWHYGRGLPVDRSALEQSGAVSAKFIDRVAEIAAERNGDGQQIITDLRAGEVANFRTNSINNLEQWLETEGYIDSEETLSVQDRERRTIMEAATELGASEVRQLVGWLEAGLYKETSN